MSSIANHLARRKAREEGEGSNDKAIPFNKQDFQTLRRECLESGKLFSDTSFPADWNSLGYNELGRYSSKTRGVEWKRPKVRTLSQCKEDSCRRYIPQGCGRLTTSHMILAISALVIC